MKKYVVLIVCFTQFFIIVYSQDLSIDSIKTQINTIGLKQVDFLLYPHLEKGAKLDDFRTGALKQTFQIFSTNNIYFNIPFENCKINFDEQTIHFKILTGVSDSLIEILMKNPNGLYIDCKEDLKIFLKNKPDSFYIKAKYLKNISINQLSISAVQKNELVNSINESYDLYNNKIDFGIASQKFDNFYVRVLYAQPLKFITILKKSPLFTCDARISTVKNDPLNYISVSPFSYHFLSLKNKSFAVADVGFDATQGLTVFKYVGSLSYQFLLPYNIINLSKGYNRIRLFPVIKIGAKYYKEEHNKLVQRSIAETFQGNAELYYFIPILDSYSLLLEGTGFYDFNKIINPNSQFKYNYSATLAYKVKKTDLKVIAKYVYGQNDNSYQLNNALMFGFLLDYMEKNK